MTTSSSKLRTYLAAWLRRRHKRTTRSALVRDSRDPVTPEQRLARAKDEILRKKWLP